MEEDLAADARKVFGKQGLDIRTGMRVTGARWTGDDCVVELDGAEPLACEKVLLAVGRRPNTEGLGLDTIGLETDGRGRIPVDERFATSVEGVFAIGDVIPGPMLAHKAEEEGIACVEGIAGGACHVDYDSIPAVVYTHPEVAGVGRTSAELDEAGIPYRTGVFPYAANGRARALGEVRGKVKILAHADTDRILGVHILGAHAGDLIAEAAVAIAFAASSEDLARASHAHPSLAEILKEAALACEGRAIHV
jgi:dihydrolipoamide dehydrogenase